MNDYKKQEEPKQEQPKQQDDTTTQERPSTGSGQGQPGSTDSLNNEIQRLTPAERSQLLSLLA